MKKLLFILFFFLFANINISSATPYFPAGMPMLGSLKGEITFWGEDTETGNYFDGVGYSYTQNIAIPKDKKNILQLRVSVSEYFYHGSKPNEIKSSVNILLPENIEDFTGKINVYILNPNEEQIMQKYEMQNKNYNNSFNYESFMNLTKAKDNAKIALELIMNNSKNICIPLNKQISQDLIEISKILYAKK